MSQLNDWSERNENADFVLEVVFVMCQGVEELCCSLRMANVGDLLMTCSSDDVLSHCWNVVVTHLLPIEHPEIVIVWVELEMVSAIFITSGVA